MDTSYFVTKEWIHRHKSGSGGWNSIQLAAIGIKWPPQAGWIDEIEGSLIPDSHRQVFEDEAGSRPKGNVRRKKAKELLVELAKWRGDK